MNTSSVRRSVSTPRHQTLSEDTAFELLSDRRRRYVLHALLEEGGVATLRELTTHLVAWETGLDAAAIAEDLRQVHLPKFEAAGVLAYYTASDVVEIRDSASELRPYLELVASEDFPAEV